MTVETTTPIVTQVYNGPKLYTFTFQAFEADTIYAFLTDANGVVTPLVAGPDFTAYLDEIGGYIITDTYPDYVGEITIYRELPIEQPVEWDTSGPFSSTILERSLDDQTMMIQQIDARVSHIMDNFVYLGDWAPSTYYKNPQAVSYDNAYYICATTHVSGNTFDPQYWSLFIDYGAVADDAAAAAISADAAKYSELEAKNAADDAGTMAGQAENSANLAAEYEARSAVNAQNSANCAGSAPAPVSGRNYLINSLFSIHQRPFTGTLASGEYGPDMWRGGSGGCTYSEDEAGQKVTVTVISGTLEQSVDGDDIKAGDYVLSWEGTAQCRISGGAWGTSGNVLISVGSEGPLLVEIGIGTVTSIQLEEGTEATSVEYKSQSAHLRDCHHTYATGTALLIGNASGVDAHLGGQVFFPTNMRNDPDISTSWTYDHNSKDGTYGTVTDDGFVIGCKSTAAADLVQATLTWTADTES